MDHHRLLEPSHDDLPPGLPASISLAADEPRPSPDPNLNGLSAALYCYPFAAELATMLDLNSLHNLSQTCHLVRNTLLQNRYQLVKRSLRCVNDGPNGQRRDEPGAATAGLPPPRPGRMTSGKVSACARDMVSECRRCNVVVCRNCVSKPLAPSCLMSRHRRLCRACARAPLDSFMDQNPQLPEATLLPTQPDDSPPSNGSPVTASSPSSSTAADEDEDEGRGCPSAYWAFRRTACICPVFSWLCSTCGHNLSVADMRYVGAWDWRRTYGRLHAGAAEGGGAQGVECGRSAFCRAVRLVEKEVEVTDTARRPAPIAGYTGTHPRPLAAAAAPRNHYTGGSFAAQEMEGVGGGRFRTKARVAERVGAPVDKDEDDPSVAADEEQSVSGGRFLQREHQGEARSWCAWCERVIPGESDGWRVEWSKSGYS